MKTILKKIPIGSKIAILVAVLIATIVQAFPREFTLQYLEDGELKTETFDTRKDFNEKIKELKANSTKYWLDLNK